MPVRPGDVLVGCQSGMKAFSSFSVCDVKADRHPCVAAAMQSRANPQKISFPSRRQVCQGAFQRCVDVCGCLLLPMAWFSAAAQTPELDEKLKAAEVNRPDPKNGLAISRTLCSTCHLIREPANASTLADISSFSRIANRPDQSLDAL